MSVHFKNVISRCWTVIWISMANTIYCTFLCFVLNHMLLMTGKWKW